MAPSRAALASTVLPRLERRRTFKLTKFSLVILIEGTHVRGTTV